MREVGVLYCARAQRSGHSCGALAHSCVCAKEWDYITSILKNHTIAYFQVRSFFGETVYSQGNCLLSSKLQSRFVVTLNLLPHMFGCTTQFLPFSKPEMSAKMSPLYTYYRGGSRDWCSIIHGSTFSLYSLLNPKGLYPLISG